MEWQYNGVAPFDEVYRWCQKNIPDYIKYNGWETLVFTDEKAYIWFILRWG